MPRQRQMSLMKNFNAIPHHSQATSKSKRIWNIHFPIYCSGTPTWLCARVEPEQNRYSTRSPTPCRRLLVFASSYFWPPLSSYIIASVHGKCFTIYWRCWCCFYEGKQFVVNFGTWTMNQNALWQLKSPQTKTRKTKTACWKNGGRENSKKWRSWTSGWVSILWPNDLNAPWTYS